MLGRGEYEARRHRSGSTRAGASASRAAMSPSRSWTPNWVRRTCVSSGTWSGGGKGRGGCSRWSCGPRGSRTPPCSRVEPVQVRRVPEADRSAPPTPLFFLLLPPSFLLPSFSPSLSSPLLPFSPPSPPLFPPLPSSFLVPPLLLSPPPPLPSPPPPLPPFPPPLLPLDLLPPPPPPPPPLPPPSLPLPPPPPPPPPPLTLLLPPPSFLSSSLCCFPPHLSPPSPTIRLFSPLSPSYSTRPLSSPSPLPLPPPPSTTHSTPLPPPPHPPPLHLQTPPLPAAPAL